MKAKLEDLRSAFALVDAVPSIAVSESGQFVRLVAHKKALKLALCGTLWAEAQAATDATEDWSAYVDRRLLKPFLATAAGDVVEIANAKDGGLVLRAGQRLEVAPHAEIAGYEQWTPKSALEPSDTVLAALRTAARYLPNVAGSEHVDAVWFGKGYGVVATDTLLMTAMLDGAVVEAEYFVPAAVAAALATAPGAKLAAEKTGMGAVFPNGYVYQSYSADLDRYPKAKCRDAIDAAAKAPLQFTVPAAELASAVSVAAQFLFDGGESARLSMAKSGNLLLAVDTSAGKFQRTLIAKQSKLKDALQWPIKRILPWLEAMEAAQPGCVVECARMENASVLRLAHNKQRYILLFADM